MGKGKEEEKKGIEVYLLWSIIVLSIEIFRYGIDGVFFGSWKSVHRKDWAFGFSNMCGLEVRFPRGEKVEVKEYFLRGERWMKRDGVSNYLSTQLYLTRDN